MCNDHYESHDKEPAIQQVLHVLSNGISHCFDIHHLRPTVKQQGESIVLDSINNLCHRGIHYSLRAPEIDFDIRRRKRIPFSGNCQKQELKGV